MGIHVATNLGWRYGPLSVLTHIVVLWGLIIVGVNLIGPGHAISSPLFNVILGFVLVFSSFPLNGLITWYFIKKHNARVRANKNSNVSSSS